MWKYANFLVIGIQDLSGAAIVTVSGLNVIDPGRIFAPNLATNA